MLRLPCFKFDLPGPFTFIFSDSSPNFLTVLQLTLCGRAEYNSHPVIVKWFKQIPVDSRSINKYQGIRFWRTCALVQSAGFSLKTQPRLLLFPISSHGLTTATVSSWVHLIVSSNLSRKFRTLLQDLFSWHPVTTTQHLSWKTALASHFRAY